MFLNECLGSFLVKNIVLVLFFLVTTIAGGLRADPLDLTCRKKGSGYLPYNERTHNWVGVGYVYDKAHCQRMIDQNSDLKNVVCSWNGSGYNIFNIESGLPLDYENPSGSNWSSLSICSKSIFNYAKENVICAPRGYADGSGIFDLSHGYFIGEGYYFDISVCNWAAWSATEDKVCSPNPSYTSIYFRRYNTLVDGELFFTSEQCAKKLNFPISKE
jgi:hypothetical protein